MRYTAIDSLEPGHILAKNIYASDGRTLLSKGVHLTVGMINQLRRVGVQMLYIENQYTEDIIIQDVVSDETRRMIMTNMAVAIQSVQGGKDINVKDINQTVNSVIDEISKNKEVLLHLTDVRTHDNKLFIHSQNVCILSTLIGVRMGLTPAQLKDLAIGALLHDLGKAVDEEKLNAINDPRSPFYNKEGSNDHTWVGFNLLRKRHDISVIAAQIPLQHHERIDGSGYPRGIDGSEMHILAKIVAIANHYDDLISNIDHQPMLPHDACEVIMGLADKHFDHDIVIKFLESVAVYPTGSSVLLTNGETGFIVEQHSGLPTRPIVRVVKKGSAGDDDPEVFEIDLAKEITVFIKKVLS